MNPPSDQTAATPDLGGAPTFSRWQDFPLIGAVLLEANAGTGKTHALVHWVLRLLIEQATPIEQILVVTFTERACQELRDRLTRLLEQAETLLDLSAAECPESHRELAEYLAERGAELGGTTLRLRLQLARQSADLAQVRTIHGFCQQALATFADLRPERLQSLPSLLLESVRHTWRQLLISEQHKPLPLHALYQMPEALAAELAPLAEQMLQPPAAIADLDGEIDQLLAHAEAINAHREWLETNALNAKGAIIKSGARNAIADLLQIFGMGEWHRLLTLKPIDRDDFFIQKAKPEVQQSTALLAVLRFDAERIALIERLRAALLQRALTAFFAEREQSRDRDRVYCFADFINLMCLRVQQDARFRGAVAAQYRHCLIDEFQDTDQRQLDIFQSLFGSPSDATPTRLLGMIGDPKQSIYRFRGADLDVYLRQRDQAGLRRGQLSKNHRSRRAVVQAVNRVFGHEQAFLAATLRLKPSDAARNPAWHDRQHPDAEAALVQVEIDRGDPLEAAAEWLSQTLQQQRFVGQQPLRALDCAILVRRNEDAEAIVRALAARGLAANVRKRSSVLESPAAADLECLLQGLDAKTEPARRRAAWTTPWLGLDAAQCFNVPEPLAQAMLQRMRTWQERIARDGLCSALAEALPLASAEALRMGMGAQWQVDSEHLLGLLATSSASAAAGLQALALLRLDGVEDQFSEALASRPASLPDAVTVSTIHAAKGLEFPVVLLPAMGKETGQRRDVWQLSAQVPPRLQLAEEADTTFAMRAETRRMAYVALTRASMMNVLFQSTGSPSTLLDAVVEGQATNWQHFLELAEQETAGLFVRETFSPQQLTRQVATLGDLQARDRQPPMPPWQIASFSSLLGRHRANSLTGPQVEGPADDERDEPTLQAADDEPIVDIEADDPVLAELAGARGTAFGDVVHRLLEAALLRPERWPSERQFREAEARLDGIDPLLALPRAALHGLLQRVLQTPLAGLPALAALRADQFAVEFGFDLRVAGFRAGALADLLRQHGYPDAAEVLHSTGTWQGFLTGSADLLIEHDGRYYVCDYKTNWLGPKLLDYRSESLADAMRAGHYRLQYVLYALALHRHLEQRLGAHYRPHEQIGGALYLFVRALGLGTDPLLGQFMAPVSADLLIALSALLDAETPDDR
ncbi:hypothetical protein C7S18_22585 [Ahniella affigens]|uniref:RecBCD enzyme subunit RecB n=1 Tax=Ahniella affigens TaxID=2021234 RepID=A0A2P1PY68_9GAMM|nr:UvrD-helicase domain-containing protein [Ahniella affigens]AVP99789.1 hypothetical protein C7S18_22585 [Ahniella affigens]